MPAGRTNTYTVLKNLGLNMLCKAEYWFTVLAGQAVSVLRWSIVYLYLPVTIPYNFTSIQSKMKRYPKGIVTEPLRISTIKAILFRMNSTKEIQLFTQVLKYQCLHVDRTFLYWAKTMQ